MSDKIQNTNTCRIELENIRYIKLGNSGSWADEAFTSGRILFGSGVDKVDHQLCLNGEWDKVEKQLGELLENQQGVSQGLRQLQTFYKTEPILWITMANGHLYWSISTGRPNVLQHNNSDMPSRYLETVDGWKNKSVRGEPLLLRNISSALTKTAGYRRTICEVAAKDYLLRLLNDERDALQIKAELLLDQQSKVALELIQRLHWTEFETLIDLIFARNGWQRTSVLGRTIPDVDFVADQQVTGSTAWVQIKASSNQRELDDYINRFEKDGSCTDFFFACHSSISKLVIKKSRHLHLWEGTELSRQAINAGLFYWLIEQI